MSIRDPKTNHETRLGRLAVERGLLSREELEALLSREERGRLAYGRRPAAKRRIGESLIAERYLTAAVLDDLLDVQRAARDLPPVAREADSGGYEVGSPLLLDYLCFVRREQAQELLLVAKRPPAVRIADELTPLQEPAVDGERLRLLVGEVFTEEEVASALSGRPVTKMIDLRVGLFRAHLSASEHGLVLSCRPVSLDVGDSTLRLPKSVAGLAGLERGLVVVAGSRSSARTNVLAQLVDLINEESERNVITIERRLSYIHESRRSLIAQREVGSHTESYRAALRSALRQDPDVLVVSEIDDAEAIATTILAAETGFLVFCSLHATEPALAIRRLIDVQSASRRHLVRATLANSLQAVVVIDIVPGKELDERYLVADVVPTSPAVARLVREDLLHQFPAVISREMGVISRDDLIVKLFHLGRVSRSVALERLSDPTRIDDVEPEPKAGRA